MADEKALRRARAKLDKALESNKTDEAIEYLEVLGEAEPKNARWPHKRGDLLRKLCRNDEAIECYAQAVDIYADQGFIARAVAMAKTVLNLDPKRIDILERVDPHTAQQLRARQRGASKRHPMVLDDASPGAAPARHPMVLDAGSPSARHPMVLDDALPVAAPARHPMVLDDAPPVAAPARHPMVLDDAPPMAAPARHPMVLDDASPVAAPARHPMVLDDAPPAAAPARHPVLDDAPPPAEEKTFPHLPVAVPALSPSPGPRAEGTPPSAAASAPRNPRVAAPPPPRSAGKPRSFTLDRLSLPPPLTALHPSSVPVEQDMESSGLADVYARALDGIEELSIDPASPPDETRFSNAPPGRMREVALSDVELEPRARLSELESLRPEPPSAHRLADLPLFPLFAEVPKPVLAQMIAGSELIELEHGQYVLRKGDPGDALYGIVEGSVDIAVPGAPSRMTLAEGDVFGESCLLQDEKRHADAVVQGKLVALRVPRDMLLQALRRHSPLAELLLELLTRRLLGNLLQGSPLFQEFDAAGRRELASFFEIRRAPAGTRLAAAGKKMDGLYISLTGTLAVDQAGAPRRYEPPGTMFGQNTLLSNTLSQVDVTTCVNMLVLRLSTAHFSRVAMQYPTILARLAELATSEVINVTV